MTSVIIQVYMSKQAQHSGALANPLQKLCDVDVCKTLEHDHICTIFKKMRTRTCHRAYGHMHTTLYGARVTTAATLGPLRLHSRHSVPWPKATMMQLQKHKCWATIC